MDKRTEKFKSSGKRVLTKATLVLLAGSAALAAVSFLPKKQPWGYIAPPALSSTLLSKGNTIAFTPWFSDADFTGDLLALPVGKNGKVILLTPDWRASLTLPNQGFDTGRRIVTTDGSGTAIPFRFPKLSPTQKGLLGNKNLVDFLRGDRTNEGPSGFRERASVLGDIVHSGPVYVGKPNAGYNYGAYPAFASSNSARAGRVYVGANDGMLHAFDAATGDEVFAYVPSMVMGNLAKLAAQPYSHEYYVDGFLNVGDVQFGGSWRSMLVGGLGAGGKGYYGIDVTSSAAATEADAAAKILWEFHSASAGAGNLGYSYSRPSIVKLNNGEWGAVVGNGYLSASGVASLYILNVQTGTVIAEISVWDTDGNGMSSPTLIDLDQNGTVDVAFAGDLNGNLWKFDLGSSSAAAWSVAHGGRALFETAESGGVRQPITTAPEVGRHPESGVIVYVGTGRLLSATEATDKTTQAVYGIWDDDWAAADVPIGIAELRTQQLKSATHPTGGSVRTVTANAIDWETHRGWVTPTEIAGAAAPDQGERVIQNMLLQNNRITFMSTNPSIATGDNWFMQLDAFTGGGPGLTIIDVNGDFVLNVADNVDGNGDSVVADTAEDRVVGEYQNFGLASTPVIGSVGTGKNAALINHLTAILPAVLPDPDDPGLIGGHFDLDTSHEIVPFSGGYTDGHVHQWDDKHNTTTIDYFSLPDGDGSPLYEISNSVNGVPTSKEFILTVANDDLSPGGILEFNGLSVSVVDYRGLLDRYLADSLLPGEKFPVLTLDEPTAAQQSAGITQLKSLKLSFDAYALVKGELIGTETGCVKKNDPGINGEYRNGAFLVQALDATDISAGFTYDAAAGQYLAGSSSIHSPHGYATTGLLWESTVFWHWKGPCYGDADWAPTWEACFVTGNDTCTESSKEDKKKGDKKKSKKNKKSKKSKKDGSDPGDDGSPTPTNPDTDGGHSVSNTTLGGSVDVGRLFWKELVPQE